MGWCLSVSLRNPKWTLSFSTFLIDCRGLVSRHAAGSSVFALQRAILGYPRLPPVSQEHLILSVAKLHQSAPMGSALEEIEVNYLMLKHQAFESRLPTDLFGS